MSLSKSVIRSYPPKQFFNSALPDCSVVDPGTFAWIQQKVKEHINKTVNSGLFVPTIGQ